MHAGLNTHAHTYTHIHASCAYLEYAHSACVFRTMHFSREFSRHTLHAHKTRKPFCKTKQTHNKTDKKHILCYETHLMLHSAPQVQTKKKHKTFCTTKQTHNKNDKKHTHSASPVQTSFLCFKNFLQNRTNTQQNGQETHPVKNLAPQYRQKKNKKKIVHKNATKIKRNIQ